MELVHLQKDSVAQGDHTTAGRIQTRILTALNELDSFLEVEEAGSPSVYINLKDSNKMPPAFLTERAWSPSFKKF
jgi:hypothetical protein